jgi:type II secretory pathway component GspD/PulD (secretin)
VQLYLISAQDSFSRELGMDTETALDVAATFANSSAWNRSLSASTADRAYGKTASASGALTAMLKATHTTGKASIVAQPLMLLLDGGSCAFQDGDTIPIPQKTVSENGAVTTSGFEYVQTGLIIKSSLREVSPSTAKCQLDIELTNITGYVDSAPIINGQKFSTTAVLETGGVYLLGSLARKQKQRNTEGPLFPMLFNKSKSSGDIQVWLRCFRIAGPLSGAPAGINATAQP